MDKAHKAISELLILTSAICGAAKIAETEIQELIDHTKAFVEHVNKPQLASGMSPERWKQLQEQQRAFYDLATAPTFQDKLTPDQHKEIGNLIKSLPWDPRPFTASIPVVVTYPNKPKAHQTPKRVPTLDPGCAVQVVKPVQTQDPTDSIQKLDPKTPSVQTHDPTDAPQTFKPKS